MSDFDKASTLFIYDCDRVEEDTGLVKSYASEKGVKWLNIYQFKFQKELLEILRLNKFDDFFKVLLNTTNQGTKMVDISSSFYINVQVLIFDENALNTEEIRFILKDDLIISFQEKFGDYFDGVREYIRLDKGIVRKRSADYLLFKLLNAIIEQYESTFANLEKELYNFNEILKERPTPDLVIEIENHKQKLIYLKAALKSIRTVSIKLQQTDFIVNKGEHYFAFLNEQINQLLDGIEEGIQLQEGNLNLIFNIQSNRLNEVMKVLTVFSVIFIPLTFIAGIYGMNFENMPELKSAYGYFIVLGAMVCITGVILLFFRRKKWL